MRIICLNKEKEQVGEITFRAMSYENAEITIAGEIGYSWDGGDYDTLRRAMQLAAAEGVKNLLVRINSPGGDALIEGLGMLNLLLNSGMNITTRNEGFVGSMAFLLFLAGSKRESYENAMLMSHGVSVSVYDANAQDLQSILNAVEKINSTFLNLIMKRSNLNEKKATALLQSDNFMTTTEAKEMGFVTDILPIKTQTQTQTQTQNDMSKQNIFAAISRFFSAKTEEEAETKAKELVDAIEQEDEPKKNEKEEDAKLAEANAKVEKLEQAVAALTAKIEALGKEDAAPATASTTPINDTNGVPPVKKTALQNAFEAEVKRRFSI